jgi:NADH/NAD ratio-sensing transcriptional regulator Rex
MSEIINVGLIGNAVLEEALATDRSANFNLKKIFAADQVAAGMARSQYPKAEIVNDIKAILDDAGIELVILSANNAKDSLVVEHIMQAGKKVRII